MSNYKLSLMILSVNYMLNVQILLCLSLTPIIRMHIDVEIRVVLALDCIKHGRSVHDVTYKCVKSRAGRHLLGSASLRETIREMKIVKEAGRG